MTNRADLIAAMMLIQRHPFFAHQDIVTFCGFLSDAEILESIERNMATVASHSDSGREAWFHRASITPVKG